jgi:hypothetical protein
LESSIPSLAASRVPLIVSFSTDFGAVLRQSSLLSGLNSLPIIGLPSTMLEPKSL